MSPRGLGGLCLLLLLLVHGPLLFGLGVDLPDDFIEYDVASWEWWRFAVRSGENPFFVPGKLGGVSLFGDVIAMGPFYPAIWLGVLLPVELALPLACVLHAALLLVGTRALAREVGASAAPAWLAGAAAACGPLGVFGIVDGRAAAWPPVAWLPVVLLCVSRAAGAGGARWVAAGGGALALAVLGGHIRVAAVVCVLAGAWGLLRGVPWRRLAALLGLGVLGGAPGVLPLLAEVRQSTGGSAGLSGLAALAEGDFGLSNLPGVLAPRATVFAGDYTVGVVLLVGLVACAVWGRGPARRLAVLAGAAVLVAAATEIPGGRVLFAPLLLLTHPVNDPWAALATVPAAAAGAVGLDLLARRAEGRIALLVVPVALLVGAVALGLVGGGLDGLVTSRARWLHAAGVAQAGVVIALLWVVLRRRGPVLMAVALLGLADLGATALRIHVAAPSAPLRLWARGRVPDIEGLRPGYVDVMELAHFEGFAYGPRPFDEERDLDPGEGGDEPVESWEAVVASVAEDLARRPLPPHLAMRIGAPALAGKAKLPPERLSDFLMPLVGALRQGPEAMDRAFAPGGEGRAVAALLGMPVIVGREGARTEITDVAPPCWLATELTVVTEPGPRRAAVLAGSPLRAVLEAALVVSTGPGEVRCTPGGADVQAVGPTLLVLNRRLHPGWRMRDDDGPLLTFPVSEVHTGVLLPPGRSVVRGRFVPPGLLLSLALALLGWTGVGWLGLSWLSPPGARSLSPAGSRPGRAPHRR